VFRIPLEPGQDASGDQLRVSVADLADISGNVAAGVWSSAWQRLNETFRYDFEAGPQGWTVDGSGWEWGAPLSGPGAAHSGRYCWATGLDGNYVNGMNASLVSPSVLLPEGEAELSIAAWYETETCCDVGYVEIDAGTGWQAWQTLRGSSGGWQILTFGLGEYGGRTLRIRFRFLSDGSASYPGLYIDDVVIGNPTPNASGRSGRTEARE